MHRCSYTSLIRLCKKFNYRCNPMQCKKCAAFSIASAKVRRKNQFCKDTDKKTASITHFTSFIISQTTSFLQEIYSIESLSPNFSLYGGHCDHLFERFYKTMMLLPLGIPLLFCRGGHSYKQHYCRPCFFHLLTRQPFASANHGEKF